MRVVGVIQGRTASTRLPSKILAPVVPGRSLLEVLATRIAPVPVDWWLATTHSRSDDVLAHWAADLGMEVHRGDEEDVLSRFVAIARTTGADWIVRATGDDPFTDAGIVEMLIDQGRRAPSLVTVVGDIEQRLPLGYVPQLVRAEALLAIADRLVEGADFHRSHVTSALLPSGGQQLELDHMVARPDYRWTVDTLDDLQMARAVFRLLGDDWADARYADLVEICDSHPEIVAMNAGVEQRALEDG